LLPPDELPPELPPDAWPPEPPLPLDPPEPPVPALFEQPTVRQNKPASEKAGKKENLGQVETILLRPDNIFVISRALLWKIRFKATNTF
jgi:hypothetical protein